MPHFSSAVTGALIGCLFLSATVLAADKAFRFPEGKFEKGELRYIDGLPVLTVEGTPEEMGRQHGTLMRREIGALQAYVEAFVGRRRLPQARRDARRLFRASCSPEILRELGALAEAAGISQADMLLAQSFSERLAFGQSQRQIVAVASAPWLLFDGPS